MKDVAPPNITTLCDVLTLENEFTVISYLQEIVWIFLLK